MCAGTGNGMAKSLLHAASEKYSVSNAVFAIIKGYFSNLFPPIMLKTAWHMEISGGEEETWISWCSGHKQSLDVCTILQGDTKFFSVLHMTWGMDLIKQSDSNATFSLFLIIVWLTLKRLRFGGRYRYRVWEIQMDGKCTLRLLRICSLLNHYNFLKVIYFIISEMPLNACGLTVGSRPANGLV